MPTYRCTCRAGFLDASKKERIARAIATAHAEVTGAPSYFAQVIFTEVPDGNQFIGGTKLDYDHVYVFGHIRAGRSAADRETLIKRLTADVAECADVEPFSVWVYLQELPPAAMVEFGHILPEPGQEHDWLASMPGDDAARLRRLDKRSKQ